MQRRDFMLAAGAALTAPRIARAADSQTLKFVPYVDLAILDPHINTASQTRTFAFMVFDTLYGLDAQYGAQPQMVEGHVVENDGKQWTLTLREGLRFHDGTPVLGRDVVASVQRWGSRDMFGQSLLDAVDTLTAPSDKQVVFKLKRPFPLLPDALGKVGPTMPAIMPERLAKLDATKPVPEVIGSGPFRFVANERVPGSRNVFQKFADYVPRRDGPVGFTSGPKIVNVARVEWLTIPDSATASAALQSGEVDWLEVPSPDLLPLLRRDLGVTVALRDATGVMPVVRFNCIQPPFDNVALRRAVLTAVDQSAFMQAYSSDPSLSHIKAGVFTPSTPMANAAGLDHLFGPTDFDAAKKAVAASGYAGQTAVVMNPTDHPVNTVVSQVAADLLQKIGVKVDQQTMDAGTMFERRNSREPIDKGGWSCFPSMTGGLDIYNPGVSFLVRGNGAHAWYGWPTDPTLEQLRNQWLDAADPASQRRLAEQIQLQVWQDPAFIPVGQILQPTAFRKSVSGIPNGFAKFWSVSITPA